MKNLGNNILFPTKDVLAKNIRVDNTTLGMISESATKVEELSDYVAKAVEADLKGREK